MRALLDGQRDRHAPRVAFAQLPVNVQHSGPMADRSAARACVLIPAYQAEKTLEGVIADLRAALPALADAIIVIDDGSTDGTAAIAKRLGCALVTHEANQGKGAALVSGLTAAHARGHEVALTVDADGQHPADAAESVLLGAEDPGVLVLGIRALQTAGAPQKNQLSNEISNYFISRFAGQPLHDTQCGLRRYPIATTLALAARGKGYDFEAEVLLRAVWAGVEIVETPIRVLYPDDRVTHFHVVRDPWRIIRTVVAALGDKHFGRAS